MKKSFLIVSLLAFISGYGVVNAVTHYVSSQHAVDDGEIRWYGSTRYLSQYNRAVQTWNNYGPIQILPDTQQTYADLHVFDINDRRSDWYGEYDHDRVGTDELRFNIAYMKDAINREQKNVALHELGHALGLAHSYEGNVMDAYDRRIIDFGYQDKLDYDYLWK